MEENTQNPLNQRVWIRNAQRNHNSLVLTIPAGIRRALNWHQNSVFLVELAEDSMVVRQMDTLLASGVTLPPHRLHRRLKSWKRGPQEETPKENGLKVEPQ